MKFVFLFSVIAAFTSINLSKGFYKAFQSDSIEIISTELDVLTSQKETSLTKAYTGALLMKKSSQLSGLKEKLNVFKEGHTLLENEISEHPSNTEFRFLRLVIQEKSPKILKYNTNIEEDKSMVISGFSKLPTDIKQFILDYCSNSTVLKSADLID